MTVFVDKSKIPYKYMKMCHMLADSIDELHEMVDNIGVSRLWFQNKDVPHYDICQSKRALAIKFGAVEIERKEMVELMQRIRKETK